MSYGRRTFIVGALAALAMGAAAGAGLAADYPNRDVTFIVPFNPGGGTDPVGREYSRQLSEIFGVGVTVVNKPGGSGTIGTAQIVNAEPDGYTIGITTNSALAFQPFVNSDLPWKSTSDYQPIVKLDSLPALIAVRADAPWNSLSEFMDFAKANPGKVRLSNSGVNTLPDLLVQQLNKRGNVEIVTAPFTGGSGEAVVALLGGRVEGYIGYGAAVMGQVQAGELKVIAVFEKGGLQFFPDADSIVEAGYPITLGTGNYVIAPKGLPQDVLDKLTEASLKIVSSESFAKFLAAQGFLPDPKGPDGVKAELDENAKDFAELLGKDR